MSTDAFPGQDPASTEVVIENPENFHDSLARAVEQVLTGLAPDDRRGILITRLNKETFTVEASNDVPNGTVLEKDSWQRPTIASSAPSHTEGAKPSRPDHPNNGRDDRFTTH